MSKSYSLLVLAAFTAPLLGQGCAHDPSAPPVAPAATESISDADAPSEGGGDPVTGNTIVTEAVPVPAGSPAEDIVRVATKDIMPPDIPEGLLPELGTDGLATSPPPLPTDEQIMEQYRIGPTDVLSFRSFDDESLNSDVTVRHDGFVSLPWIPDVKLGGLTRDEATNVLREAYQELYFEAEVSVQITQATSKTYTVMGDVNRPAEYPYTKPITLLDAIIGAGSLRVNQRGGDSFVGGQGQLVKAFIVRGTGAERTVGEYDLRNLEQEGTQDAYEPILPGDIVYIPEGINLVYVLGAVGRPGIQPLSEGMTMLQFLASVGGVTETVARMKQIVLIRNIDEGRTELQLLNVKEMLRTGKDMLIQPGDIIYVPRRRMVNVAMLMRDAFGTVTPIINITQQVMGLYSSAFATYYTKDRYDLLYNTDNINQTQTNLQLLEAIRQIGSVTETLNGIE